MLSIGDSLLLRLDATSWDCRRSGQLLQRDGVPAVQYRRHSRGSGLAPGDLPRGRIDAAVLRVHQRGPGGDREHHGKPDVLRMDRTPTSGSTGMAGRDSRSTEPWMKCVFPRCPVPATGSSRTTRPSCPPPRGRPRQGRWTAPGSSSRGARSFSIFNTRCR